jgi:hypothetical protein
VQGEALGAVGPRPAADARLEHPAARNLIRALPASILFGAGSPGAESMHTTWRMHVALARAFKRVIGTAPPPRAAPQLLPSAP